MDLLDAIGNTSLVRLRKVVPPDCATILVKLEWENPTGSLKDRLAQALISRAEADGRLKPGGTVVEYTGGSTGTSLALVCAVKGYRLRIVTSDAFSREKLDHMAALGAELTLVPSDGGRTTRKMILDMIEVARELSREPGTYWTDQLSNQDSIAGFPLRSAERDHGQTGGGRRLLHCVGSRASSRGGDRPQAPCSTDLDRGVEPAESSVLLGARRVHTRSRSGNRYTPPLWEPSLMDGSSPSPGGEGDGQALPRRVTSTSGSEPPPEPTCWLRSRSGSDWVRMPRWSP
jgi:cysteine synthase A